MLVLCILVALMGVQGENPGGVDRGAALPLLETHHPPHHTHTHTHTHNSVTPPECIDDISS